MNLLKNRKPTSQEDSSVLKRYASLVKLGIIRGNILATIGGFLLASRGNINASIFSGVVSGTSLIIASACVFNNIIDKDVDKKMERTKNRPLATGSISPKSATLFGGMLGCVGAVILLKYTNSLTFYSGVVGFLAYVGLYGWAKRHTEYSTLIGGISGSMPLTAGYLAVSNSITSTAILLAIVMAFWQMPHFYAISLFRKNDYASAELHVMSVIRGNNRTKVEILLYTFGFMLSCMALSIYGETGMVFSVVMTVLSLCWLWYGLKGFNAKDDITWAKGMFGISLLALLLMSIMLSVNSFIP